MTEKINENEKLQAIDEIINALRLIIPENQITELRAIGKGTTNYTEAGYYNDFSRMAEAAVRITEYANGVYFVPNPIKPELLERSNNETQKGLNPTTSDNDILSRRWLLIDCDPVRPSGVSSTDVEKAAAMAKVRQIREWLTGKGWPQPITADSGNGGHLLYRIDIPAKDGDLIKRTLEALSIQFTDKHVKIDTVNHNSSRIWKLYGTWAHKGDDTAERTHRQSKVIWDETPEVLETVTQAQLEEIAIKAAVKTISAQKITPTTSTFDVAAWISKHELNVTGPKDFTSSADGEIGQKWVFNTCPWNPDHDDRSAWILQLSSGAISAGCKHEGCQGKNWQSLRLLYEENFKFTEFGNAERLIYRHGDNLRYNPQQDSWLIWDGTCWVKKDDTGEIIQLAKATVRSIQEHDRRKETKKWVNQSESESRIRAMINLAKTEPGIPINMKEMDTDPYLLNCQNGTLDLRTRNLLSHNKNYYCTKMIPTEFKGYNYTNDLWNSALDNWTGNDESMKDFLQRAVGYSITGDTRERVLFFMFGPTSTGKSSFIEAVKSTFFQYSLTSDFETFIAKVNGGGPRNDLARLVGSRIVVANEVGKYKKFDQAVVKAITGNDTITCRPLYKEAFEFKPIFKLWLVANDAPEVDNDDEAMWDRIMRVPFDQSIPHGSRIKNLKDELAKPEVCSAILTWAVNGCLKWQKDGLKIPDRVRASNLAYRRANDPFLVFFEEKYSIEPSNPDIGLSLACLYEDYNNWAKLNGETQLTHNRPLVEKLKSLGCGNVL